MISPVSHVTSDIFQKSEHPICGGDYAQFCKEYWQGCFDCPSYMENADFFCRKFNIARFGKERIEPENQKPWWDNPAFVIPRKTIYGIEK